MGGLLGSRIPAIFDGLDFALVCLFAVLAIEQVKASGSMAPVLIAAAINALIIGFDLPQPLTLAVFLSSATVGIHVFLRRRS